MSTVVVVGAGLAGLLAAGRLSHAGHRVIVVDKGRGVGGRLATRRIAVPDGRRAIFDHGAQFFTVRDRQFAEHVDRWIGDGIVFEWCRGFDEADGHPRYAVRGGMTALAKHLARSLDVRTSTLVFSVAEIPNADAGRSDHRYRVAIDDGTHLDADAVIVTCPVPQSYSLTVEAGIAMPRDLLMGDYDRTIGLLVVLDGPSNVRPPGGEQNPSDIFSWVADNAMKGISEVPALTLHANARWSAEHWDLDSGEGQRILLEHAQPFFGSSACVSVDYKKWRFATPRQPWPAPFHAEDLVVFAGDAFAGPKVEGAALSGLAAADHLLAAL